MKNRESHSEALPYRSTATVEPEERVLPEDEEDFAALKQVFKIIVDAEKKYSSIDTLVIGDPVMTLDKQVAAYQFALNDVIIPIKQLLEDTIGEIKLKQRGVIHG